MKELRKHIEEILDQNVSDLGEAALGIDAVDTEEVSKEIADYIEEREKELNKRLKLALVDARQMRACWNEACNDISKLKKE